MRNVVHNLDVEKVLFLLRHRMQWHSLLLPRPFGICEPVKAIWMCQSSSVTWLVSHGCPLPSWVDFKHCFVFFLKKSHDITKHWAQQYFIVMPFADKDWAPATVSVPLPPFLPPHPSLLFLLLLLFFLLFMLLLFVLPLTFPLFPLGYFSSKEPNIQH